LRFVLVHGGFHGAWCWDLLSPELEQRGHEAIAIELPGHGKRADEAATLATYRDAIVEVLEPGDVLVAHSLGGFPTTVAADAAVSRVRHIVYLAAGLPIEGQPMATAGAGGAMAGNSAIGLSDDGTRATFNSLDGAREFFYNDCSPEIVEWAYSKLTPQPLAPLTEPISIPNFWEANLPRSLILCQHDNAGGDKVAVDQTIRRLGVDPFWMETSHSPFLSRPSECADRILAATARPPVGPLSPQ
jgi:pimeloyl-ACP methyl ester carboxylesterase